jgi:hypothetical protein
MLRNGLGRVGATLLEQPPPQRDRYTHGSQSKREQRPALVKSANYRINHAYSNQKAG